MKLTCGAHFYHHRILIKVKKKKKYIKRGKSNGPDEKQRLKVIVKIS